jgi:hypothetical protein
MGYVQLLSLQESTVLSDDLISAADTERETTNSTYTLIKSILRLTEVYPQCKLRVKHDMRTNLGTGYSQIYKNGQPIAGTESSNGSGSYITYTFDLGITDFKAFDTLEVWAKNSGGVPTYHTYVKNFRIYGINVPYVEIA